MSQFEGVMGGGPGTGYVSSRNNDIPDTTNQGFVGASGDTAASLGTPTPQPSQAPPHPGYLAHQTPQSAGSITQFYSPPPAGPAATTSAHHHSQYTMQQPVYNPGMPAYHHHQQHQQHQQHQHQQHQQHQQQQQQQFQQQPVMTQPHTMVYNQAPSNLQQPFHPPSVQTHYNVHQSQVQHPQHMTPQAAYQTQTPSSAGSYAARSAQAHVAMGSQAAPDRPAVPTMPVATTPQTAVTRLDDSPAIMAQQTRVLTECTRKVQENAYYMKQAMDKGELSTVLDRASQMVGELGDASSGQLTPKNYYELHMRALDDMPNLEDYFLSIASAQNSAFSMKELYHYVQYCPRVLARLYLQISAGSALIRSKEESAQWVLADLIDAVKCVQNPLRGLFLRHFLLQATRDKLPDGKDVKDAYEFVLANFIEMNKLWVRIQHLPGDGKTKEQRKRRERERNELRILVGTNLVRLSQLEAVTSKIYGETILPTILEQITACGDPLAQAYLMDCIIQVFPDECHIETLPVLLAVCPKLRDKVNIRTIMQSLMDRLANYYADEELLDEADTNQVKKSVAQDSFPLFEECVQKVYHARGPKLVAKEVIRLQTALLNFSLKCYPGNTDRMSNCLGVCIDFIRQAANAAAIANQSPILEDSAIKLDEASITELQKLLSIPLDTLAVKVLELDQYSSLLQFLPFGSRRDIGMTMLRAIEASGTALSSAKELSELFNILYPVIRLADPNTSTGTRLQEMQEEDKLVSKLIHILDHDDPNVVFEMLGVARSHLSEGGGIRMSHTLVPVVFAGLRLVSRIVDDNSGKGQTGHRKVDEEKLEGDNNGDPSGDENTTQKAHTENEERKTGEESVEGEELPVAVDESAGQAAVVDTVRGPLISVRKVFVFIQTTIAMLAKGSPELAMKLYTQAALSADKSVAQVSKTRDNLDDITAELLVQATLLYEDEVSDPQTQQRCIVNLVGTLLSILSLSKEEYERLITKVAQFAARLLKKQDQCRMVGLCSHLFYSVGTGTFSYQNPQRTLECLQRSLKLADASASGTPSNVSLFVDLLEQYVYFYEQNNPAISDTYITGLVALVREHLDSMTGLAGLDATAVGDARSHFLEVIEYITRKKATDETSSRFALILVGS